MKKVIKFLLSLVLVSLLLTPSALAAKGDTTIKVTKPTEVNITEGNLGDLIKNGITVALGLAAMITFVFLIWGGIQWITSGGDKAQYEAARNRITYALVGLAIVAAAWAIMQLISRFFGVDFENIRIPGIQG